MNVAQEFMGASNHIGPPSWGVHCRIGRPVPVEIGPNTFIAMLEGHTTCALDACNCPCHPAQEKDDGWLA